MWQTSMKRYFEEKIVTFEQICLQSVCQISKNEQFFGIFRLQSQKKPIFLKLTVQK